MHTLNEYEQDTHPHDTILIIHTVEGVITVRKDLDRAWGDNLWNHQGTHVSWTWLKNKYKNWEYTVLYEDDDVEEEVP